MLAPIVLPVKRRLGRNNFTLNKDYFEGEIKAFLTGIENIRFNRDSISVIEIGNGPTVIMSYLIWSELKLRINIEKFYVVDNNPEIDRASIELLSGLGIDVIDYMRFASKVIRLRSLDEIPEKSIDLVFDNRAVMMIYNLEQFMAVLATKLSKGAYFVNRFDYKGTMNLGPFEHLGINDKLYGFISRNLGHGVKINSYEFRRLLSLYFDEIYYRDEEVIFDCVGESFIICRLT